MVTAGAAAMAQQEYSNFGLQGQLTDQPVSGPQSRKVVRAAASTQRLNNNLPSWRETTVQYTQQAGSETLLGTGLTRTSRFNLNDWQFNALYSTKLSSALRASLDANVSPSHRVLARYALDGQLHYEFQPAWLAHVGLKTSSYNDATVNQLPLGLEHYFSAFSISLGLRPTRAFGRTVYSGEARGNFYYDDHNSVGFLVASGREATPIGANVALIDVRAVAIIGQHWLNRHWALTYAVNRTRQGTFYTRRGVDVGIQYAF
jgi:YaiO family outer membrane protein